MTKVNYSLASGGKIGSRWSCLLQFCPVIACTLGSLQLQTMQQQQIVDSPSSTIQGTISTADCIHNSCCSGGDCVDWCKQISGTSKLDDLWHWAHGRIIKISRYLSLLIVIWFIFQAKPIRVCHSCCKVSESCLQLASFSWNALSNGV